MRRLWAPALGALLLAGCTTGPVYTYGPASYATPPRMAPSYEPVPIPLPGPLSGPMPGSMPGPAVTATPLGAPTDLYAPQPDRPAIDPYALPPSVFEPAPSFAPSSAPPVADTPPASAEPAPSDAAPSDPVTDLLLMPPSNREAAPAAVVKKPTAPEANPMMGFRPMRGQTAPTP